MKKDNKLETEDRILKIVQNCIHSFSSRFRNSKVSTNQAIIERSGENNSYFSEIEIEFWKSSNLIDALSIIIFMQGQLVRVTKGKRS